MTTPLYDGDERGSRASRTIWFIFFVFLFYYRAAFSVLGELVVMRITSIPDTRTYQGAQFFEQLNLLLQFSDSYGWRLSWLATRITKVIGGFFNSITFGNPILINICFQSIAFAGICLLLMSVEPRIRKKLAIFFLLPSFSLWSSIASKEAIIVFAMCASCAYAIKMLNGDYRIRWYHLLGLSLLYIYKARFAPAVIFLLGSIWVASRIRQKAALAMIGAGASLLLMYIFAGPIDTIARQASSNLASDRGRSLRPQFLVEEFDTFTKAPEGMWLSFVGPTMQEVGTSVLHLFSFVESMILVAILLFLLLTQFSRMPVFSFIVGITTTFWILFTNYPVGVQNSGSAIRFRTDYIVLIFTVFAVIFSRQVYVKWLSTSGRSKLAKPKQDAFDENPD